MNIVAVQGDLIKMFDEGHFDAIGHGCNTIHAMKSGIAKTLDEYTGGELSLVDKTSPYGNANKMGTFTVLQHNKGLIYNLYTQFIPAYKNMVAVHWYSVADALFSSINDALSKTNNDSKLRYGIPLIGCGLANGDKADLSIVLHELSLEFADNVELTVVSYDME